MTELREYCEKDLQEIIRIWREAFGDSEESIACFYRLLPGFGSSLVAVEGGKPVAVASAVEGRIGDKQCAYIYAVCVDSAFRGFGIGKAISKGISDFAKARGAEIISGLPADSARSVYFRKYMNVTPRIFRRKYEAAAAEGAAEKIGAEEYYTLREKLLEGRNHMSFPKAYIDYIDFLSTDCGGGIFKTAGGICACTVENGICRMDEIISENPGTDAGAVAYALGCGKAEYFLTAPSGEEYIVADRDIPKDLIYNLLCE